MSLSLYLHFPFCYNKCSYCDFYKELYSTELEKSFFKALKKETVLALDELKKDKRNKLKIATIFVGGGTPSVATLELFDDWFNLLKSEIEIPEKIEFSFEANPESVTRDKLEHLKQLGVNRPTFGIQTFHPRLLEILGRKHQPHHTQQAVYMTNALRFAQFGVDLIFGIPTQSSKILSEDISKLLDLDPPHISFYQLILEDGTPLKAKYDAGEIHLDNQETMLALFKIGCEKFKEAGYTRYEVCSFAKPGFECRHNIGYWQGDDYLGLGPAAHSFIRGERFFNRSSIVEYKKALDQNILPRAVDESDKKARMAESIMLGLRTMWGVSRGKFYKKYESKLEDSLDLAQYEMLLKSGHLIDDENNLKLSEEGIYLVEEIVGRLIK